MTRWDPFGLLNWKIDLTGPGGTAQAEDVVVTGSDPNLPGGGTGAPRGGGGPGGAGGGEPGIGPGGRGSERLRHEVLRVDYGVGNPSYVGSGTEEDPSNWGTTGDPGVYVNWIAGPLPNQTIPGAVFYGTNPGGYTATPLANYRLQIDPNKIIVPVTRRFASYNLKSFANVMDYGVAYPAAGFVAAPVLGPLALNGVYYGGWYTAAAAAAVYQTVLRYPGAISNAQQALNSFITPGWQVPTNGPETVGTAANIIAGEIDPKDFGP